MSIQSNGLIYFPTYNSTFFKTIPYAHTDNLHPDNAHALWILHYQAWRPLPENFHIVTTKARDTTNDGIAGRIRAVVVIRAHQLARPKPGIRASGNGDLSLFVQGPQAETTEEALKVLLTKTETMIGARWERYEFARKEYLDQ